MFSEYSGRINISTKLWIIWIGIRYSFTCSIWVYLYISKLHLSFIRNNKKYVSSEAKHFLIPIIWAIPLIILVSEASNWTALILLIIVSFSWQYIGQKAHTDLSKRICYDKMNTLLLSNYLNVTKFHSLSLQQLKSKTKHRYSNWRMNVMRNDIMFSVLLNA